MSDDPRIVTAERDGIPGLGEYQMIARGEDAHGVEWEVGVDIVARRVLLEHGADVSFLTHLGAYALVKGLLEAAVAVEWAAEDAT